MRTHVETRPSAYDLIVRAVRDAAYPLERAPSDFDPLLERIGDARVVLLGEATHGTHEFYRARAELTRRLIAEKGFDLVAVEGDWPDAYRVNRWVRAASDDADAEEALRGFERFPGWMWRNGDVLDFVGWLRDYNDGRPAGRPAVGFYGLDLYSLRRSIEAILHYLDQVDPTAAASARDRYACFDRFGEDTRRYAYATTVQLAPTCERDVVHQLLDLQHRRADLAARDGRIPEDEFFFAEQNARLVVRAEAYYRAMLASRTGSWNLRDRHMAETLAVLIAHFRGKGQAGKVVVWEHNSHVGDASATQMGAAGELNVGRLARETYGRDAFLVGFTTHSGTVTAASEWDGPAERMRVRPALPSSYEAVLHDAGLDRFLLLLDDRRLVGLEQPRLERAIGVVYRPETERQSHYFAANIRRQFDALVHHDHTRAVEPLERTVRWEAGEPPETYPSGL